MEKATYHERHVLGMAGYEEKDWTDGLILLARRGLELCYYEDQAARWLIDQLRRNAWIRHW